MDLMSDYHRTVMVNDNISYLYMMYQAVVMGASMLAPATVVLMVAGAIHVVVGGGLYWLWLAMSIGAAVFYMVVCFRYPSPFHFSRTRLFPTDAFVLHCFKKTVPFFIFAITLLILGRFG